MRRWTLLVLVLAVTASACGTGNTGAGGQDGGEGSDLSGTVAIDGSSTVFPVSEAVAEEFQIENPGVQVTVGQSGTGGGFEKFCNGETDISNASRPIKEEELENCEEAGIQPVMTEAPEGLQVAIDGLTVAVHPDNDFIDCLTVEQLQEMWKPDTSVETWSDVDPSFPDEQISFYSPGADSGTFDYFTDEIVGEEGSMRTGPDVQTSEDDNILVQGIAGDRWGIGYFGYAYFAENRDQLEAVAIDGGNGCVEPTDETIESGEYTPLSRPLFIYPSAQALEREEVQTFIDYYLDNVSSLVTDVGYIPVSEEKIETARQAVEAATT